MDTFNSNNKDEDLQKNMPEILTWAYTQVVNGVVGIGSAEDLAEEYLHSNNYDKLEAINSLIRWQNTRAATGGFITNLGGLITLPVSIPANLVTSIYIQLRMIAAIASISGKELGDDKIKTLCILCLTGNNSAEILKQAGIKIAEKYTAGLIQKYITRDIIIYINKAVGFRLITKAGSTGILNLTKAVPIVGGLVGATFDGITTNIIGNTARDLFLEKNPL
ncbi:EcsC family protein [Snodgrassella sp. ESL0324]|uniref:EcsC family protein n=1 Tax=Snodgrassella sp. ESL0324 TaxID=2705033 RepID=UPI0015834FE4|nr:EcsC family protein [Snodgrassella sp. ESL0324]